MSDDPTKDHSHSDRRRTGPKGGPSGSGDARKAPPRPSRGEAFAKKSRFGGETTKSRPPRKKFAPLSGSERKPQREIGEEPGGGAPVRGEDPNASLQRIAKVMARAGACSRRDAEVWISEGRVALNGVALTNPAINVGDGDKITVDGAPLAQRARTRLFLFHKPRGLVTTDHDPEGRETIFDFLRHNWPEGPRVISVGRLDINTEGLLLLTNDGGLARVLELPSTGWVRRYRVRAKGQTDQSVLDRLRDGVAVDGVDYAEIDAKLDRVQGANSWLTIGLREGKNREIKRVLEHIGLEVNRLIRLSFGPFQLAELAEGAVEEIRTRILRDQLGPALAEAAGVDFTSPAGDQAEAMQPAEIPPKRHGRVEKRSRQEPNRRPPLDRPHGGYESARNNRASETPARDARNKPTPGPRKHISALRADRGEQGARKKIERGETADRRGRTVPVERLVITEQVRGKKQDKPAPTTRNGRRFEAERQTRDGVAARPARGAERNPSPFAARKDRSQEQTQRRGAAPAEGSASATPRLNSGETRQSSRHRDHGSRDKQAATPRRGFDERKDRSRGDERQEPRRGRSPRAASGERPQPPAGRYPGRGGRSDEPASRPRRPYDGDKDRSRSDARPARENAPKRFGAAKPFGQKSSGSRPGAFAAKPGRIDARPRGAGPAAGFRGKDKRPGGKGGNGAASSRGPTRPGKGGPRDRH
jgi:23S rRNA pseudouridine2605 synthase